MKRGMEPFLVLNRTISSKSVASKIYTTSATLKVKVKKSHHLTGVYFLMTAEHP